MDKETIILAIVAFVLMVIYFYYSNLLKLAKKAKKNAKKPEVLEIKYLSITAHLKENNLKTRKMLFLFSVINALIIDFVFLVVLEINIPLFFRFLIGLVLFLGLIYSVYGILGKILVMKGYDKDEYKRN